MLTEKEALAMLRPSSRLMYQYPGGIELGFNKTDFRRLAREYREKFPNTDLRYAFKQETVGVRYPYTRYTFLGVFDHATQQPIC